MQQYPALVFVLTPRYNDAMEQEGIKEEEVVGGNASRETGIEDEVDALRDKAIVSEGLDSSSRKKAAYRSTDVTTYLLR